MSSHQNRTAGDVGDNVAITDGLSFGFITYVVVKVARAKFKDIHPLMYVIVCLFIIKYILSALSSMGVL